ncbi:uncharacterized protein KQ657_004360 [Scheffersomyces spartinae]|uniref:Uncharacterized protein n=1 Tax=Scheffersomyces spartinae TaxID=45513 RepID=A0A9P8AIR9_9ASCO|nr:uncharacterized protein KQ657_004360 [Scheffersomyces spartinae]KAG7194683.1 hypothetical protein KQ657_004360 [Scheffersomyces spartinae]
MNHSTEDQHQNPLSSSGMNPGNRTGTQLQPQFSTSPTVPLQYLQQLPPPPPLQIIYSNNQQDQMGSHLPAISSYTFPRPPEQAPNPSLLSGVSGDPHLHPHNNLSTNAWKQTSPNIIPPVQSYSSFNPQTGVLTNASNDTSRSSYGQVLEPTDLQPIQHNVHPSFVPQIPVTAMLPTGSNPHAYHQSIVPPISTSSLPQKRTQLPCPEDIVLSLRQHKRLKITDDESIYNEKFTPMAHTAPSDMIPIIPLKTSIYDFYTDFPKVTDVKVHEQVQNILYQFPPPYPPSSSLLATAAGSAPTAEDFRHRYMTSSEDSGLDNNATPNTSPTSTPRVNAKQIPCLEGGIYVPFIYPPPPIIKPSEIPYSLSKFRESIELLQQNGNNNNNVLVPSEYPEIAPLPFPPSNYMPYPIHSDKGPLTPPEVVDSFLDALKYLPRVDMIVASAAGSLYELLNSSPDQISNLIAKQDELRRKEDARVLGEEFLDDDSVDDHKDDAEKTNEGEDEDDYAFLKHIDYQDYYRLDSERKPIFPWSKDSVDSQVVVNTIPSDYASTTSIISDSRNGRNDVVSKGAIERYNPFTTTEVKEIELDRNVASYPDSIKEIIPNINRDIVSASGNFFLRRQADLKDALTAVESFTEEKKHQIYQEKKLALLEKLSTLRKSKIKFIAEEGDIMNEELQQKLNDIGVERDTELIRQKLADDYEKLKCSLQFYQDSNKAYKNLNLMMVNKLQKLKNFFEYQRKILNLHLEDKSSEIFDIKSKESSKLFYGVNNDTDYAQVIKKALRHKSESVEPEEEDSFIFDNEGGAPTGYSASFSPQDSNLFKDPHSISDTLLAKSSTALVHDLMPLITPAEFDLITGDLPNQVKNLTMKSKSADKISKSNLINVKHKIFQSALYDPMYTSGSDSNTSDFAAMGTGVIDRLVFNAAAGDMTNSGMPQSSNVSTGGGSGPGPTTPKRRGRRAAASLSSNSMGHLAPGGSKSVEDIDVSKYLEALLLAKIMKHFQGPQIAKGNELNEDLDAMGINTRWPVK